MFEVGVWAGAALLAVAGLTHAATLDWVPADTRVLVRIDPENIGSQARTREALGLDDLLGRMATGSLPASQVQDRVVAYIVEGTASRPVALTFGQGQLGPVFEKLRGEKLETAGGKAIYASPKTAGWGMALVEPRCIAEGPRQTLRAVFQHVAADGRTVEDLPGASVVRRLVGLPAGPETAVGLVYVAPAGGSDLYTVLRDLDRTLGADLSGVLASYQNALKMLGTTQGLRLDVRQEPAALGTTLRMVMPNSTAAQITSVSLQAGRDLAKVASDAAVKAGTMSIQDAGVLAGALETMQAGSEGDLVTVRLRVADGAGGPAQ